MVGFVRRFFWRLSGEKVPVVRLSNNARTIEFMGYLKKRENSLIEPWKQKGYEIRSPPIEIVINGKKEIGYAADEAGITVTFNRDIKVRPAIEVGSTPEDLFGKAPDELLIPQTGEIRLNFDGIIGRCSTLDDIAEGLELGKSWKNTVIGIVIGLVLGWVLTTGMSS
jgi:hypothetical protein